MTVEEFKNWIRGFDADHDGTISRQELQEAVRSLRVWLAWWKARRGMEEAGLNRSGRIDDAEEFERLVTYAQQQGSMIHKVKKFSCY
ncbi:EF-hand domain-containing protein [Psidium guajava]|nr:EF-hand domain-containing protein [Psidium guajava]